MLNNKFNNYSVKQDKKQYEAKHNFIVMVIYGLYGKSCGTKFYGIRYSADILENKTFFLGEIKGIDAFFFKHQRSMGSEAENLFFFLDKFIHDD